MYLQIGSRRLFGRARWYFMSGANTSVTLYLSSFPYQRGGNGSRSSGNIPVHDIDRGNTRLQDPVWLSLGDMAHMNTSTSELATVGRLASQQIVRRYRGANQACADFPSDLPSFSFLSTCVFCLDMLLFRVMRSSWY